MASRHDQGIVSLSSALVKVLGVVSSRDLIASFLHASRPCSRCGYHLAFIICALVCRIVDVMRQPVMSCRVDADFQAKLGALARNGHAIVPCVHRGGHFTLQDPLELVSLALAHIRSIKQGEDCNLAGSPARLPPQLVPVWTRPVEELLFRSELTAHSAPASAGVLEDPQLRAVRLPTLRSAVFSSSTVMDAVRLLARHDGKGQLLVLADSDGKVHGGNGAHSSAVPFFSAAGVRDGLVRPPAGQDALIGTLTAVCFLVVEINLVPQRDCLKLALHGDPELQHPQAVLAATRVFDIMNLAPVCIRARSPVLLALEVAARHRLRHLTVRDARLFLIGYQVLSSQLSSDDGEDHAHGPVLPLGLLRVGELLCGLQSQPGSLYEKLHVPVQVGLPSLD